MSNIAAGIFSCQSLIIGFLIQNNTWELRFQKSIRSPNDISVLPRQYTNLSAAFAPLGSIRVNLFVKSGIYFMEVLYISTDLEDHEAEFDEKEESITLRYLTI